MPGQNDPKRAPMGSAPLRYREDGSVDWGNMWDTFCALAQTGGPPHREEMLQVPSHVDPVSAGYQFALNEIIRGIAAVSGLTAAPAAPGWIAVQCPSVAMAQWLAEAIIDERVQARADGSQLLVPVGDGWTLTGEIKNVITVVAKTTHYWHDHLPPDVKRTLALQAQLGGLKQRIGGWFRRQGVEKG